MSDRREKARTVRRANERAHLAAVAAGVTNDVVTYRTAPLPAGVQVKPWDECGCSYQPPMAGGRRVPQRLDPAWQFTEEPPRTGSPVMALRWMIARMMWGEKLGGRWLAPFYPLGGFHSGDPRWDMPGMLDLVAWPPGRPLVRELKRMGKVPELPQATHLTAMELAGWDAGLWRPCCLLSGRISAELAAAAGVPLHPDDEYAAYRVRPLPDPDRPTRPAGRPAPAPRDPAPAPHPALAELLDGDQPARGYVIMVAGVLTEEQAQHVATLRRWMSDQGIHPVRMRMPWGIVVAGDAVHVLLRAVGALKEWRHLPGAAKTFPARDADELAEHRGSVLVDTNPTRLKTQIEKRRGVRNA